MRYTIDPRAPVMLKSDDGSSTVDGAGCSVILAYQLDELEQENATLIAALKTIADWHGPCQCEGCVCCFAREIVEA
jgi:hypothetical protein